MPARRPSLGQVSAACSAADHGRCRHSIGMGGGLNPRSRRLEFGIGLCACDCHAECPLSGRDNVSPAEWTQACSCAGRRLAGADATEPPPSFSQFLRDKHVSDARVREVVAEVRSRSAGKSREEMRQELREALRSAGTPMPSDARIDRFADSIAQGGAADAPEPTTFFGNLNAFAGLVHEFTGELREISRLFRGVHKLRDPDGREPYTAAPGSVPSVAEVILEPGADSVLEEQARLSKPRPAGSEERPGHLVPVRLESAASPGQEDAASDAEPLVIVYVGRHRVGRLNRDDSRAMEPELATARRNGMSMMMLGIYAQRGPSEQARLLVYPTGPPRG